MASLFWFIVCGACSLLMIRLGHSKLFLLNLIACLLNGCIFFIRWALGDL